MNFSLDYKIKINIRSSLSSAVICAYKQQKARLKFVSEFVSKDDVSDLFLKSRPHQNVKQAVPILSVAVVIRPKARSISSFLTKIDDRFWSMSTYVNVHSALDVSCIWVLERTNKIDGWYDMWTKIKVVVVVLMGKGNIDTRIFHILICTYGRTQKSFWSTCRKWEYNYPINAQPRYNYHPDWIRWRSTLVYAIL